MRAQIKLFLFIFLCAPLFVGCMSSETQVISESEAEVVPLRLGKYQDHPVGKVINITRKGKTYLTNNAYDAVADVGNSDEYLVKRLTPKYYLLQKKEYDTKFQYFIARIEKDRVIKYDVPNQYVKQVAEISNVQVDSSSASELKLTGSKKALWSMFKHIAENEYFDRELTDTYKSYKGDFGFRFTNNSEYSEVSLAIYYYDNTRGSWVTTGWWNIKPGEEITPNIRTTNEHAYIYVQTDNNRALYWDTKSIKKYIIYGSFETEDGDKLYDENKRLVKFYKINIKKSGMERGFIKGFRVE